MPSRSFLFSLSIQLLSLSLFTIGVFVSLQHNNLFIEERSGSLHIMGVV